MPLLWFSLSFIFGIAAAPLITIRSWLLLVGGLAAFIFGILEIRFSRTRYHSLIANPLFKIPVAFLLLGFCFGNLCFQNNLPQGTKENITAYSDTSPALVKGMVSSDPKRYSRYTLFEIKCDGIYTVDGWVNTSGKMKVFSPTGPYVQYGDMVTLEGNLQSTYSEDTFPIRSYEAIQKIFVKMASPEIRIIQHNQGNPIIASLYHLRERAFRNIHDMMPFPESAVLSGILLGRETSIPEYLMNGYRGSGTAHIIVISGFNISILAMMLYSFFNRTLKHTWILPATFLAVILYTLLAGADQPVIRAAIMVLIGLPARQIGRRAIGIHSLSTAAALMLLFNPFLLWDISFQLSFLATLALLTMVDPIMSWLERKFAAIANKEFIGKTMPFIELFITTLCATIVVFPILFQLNNTVSTTSIIANLLIGPVQPPIMFLGGTSVVLSLVSPGIGGIFAKTAWPFLAFCNQIAIRSSIHPASSILLPEWFYWVSLFASIVVLMFFTIFQISHFIIPKVPEE